MANTLTTYTSEDVQDEAVLTGKPTLVRVMVEDENDVPFWQDILNDTLPNKVYDICPYSKKSNGEIVSGRKGKQHILKEARDGVLSNNNIGCIDSDYDYIFYPHTKDSEITQNTTHLIQTYTYSIENLLLQPETLNNVIIDTVKLPCSVDINKLVVRLSEMLYPLVIWSFVVEQHKDTYFTGTSWHNVLPLHPTMVQSDENELLEDVQSRINWQITNLCSIYGEQEWHDAKKELGTKRNITPKTAYKYVRGHDLFDYIHTVILKPISDRIHKEHIQEIKNKTSLGQDNITTEIQEYLGMTQKNIQKHLSRNFLYKVYAPETKMIKECILHAL